jgi:hypothetical protein
MPPAQSGGRRQIWYDPLAACSYRQPADPIPDPEAHMLGSTCADLAPPPARQRKRCAPSPCNERLRPILEHTVAPVFAVARAALWAPKRGSPPEAFARQVAMYLVHVGLGLSLSEVARLFARDRRTVAHACALVEDRRDAAPFDRALDLLEGALRLLAPRQP